MYSTKGSILLALSLSIFSLSTSYAYAGILDDFLKSLSGGLSIVGRHIIPPSRGESEPEIPGRLGNSQTHPVRSGARASQRDTNAPYTIGMFQEDVQRLFEERKNVLKRIDKQELDATYSQFCSSKLRGATPCDTMNNVQLSSESIREEKDKIQDLYFRIYRDLFLRQRRYQESLRTGGRHNMVIQPDGQNYTQTAFDRDMLALNNMRRSPQHFDTAALDKTEAHLRELLSASTSAAGASRNRSPSPSAQERPLNRKDILSPTSPNSQKRSKKL